jgi:hypothetical protein
MGFRFLDRTSGLGVELSAATLHGLMEAASDAFEKDGGWVLEGTLRGERRTAADLPSDAPVVAIAYEGLHVTPNGEGWQGTMEFRTSG